MSISSALIIAKATGLDDWIINKLKKSDSGAAKLAGKIIGFATQATGFENPEHAAKQLAERQDQNEQFILAVTANEHELKKLAFEDRKDARAMYQVHNNQADNIAGNVIKYNLPIIGLLFIVIAVASYFLREQAALMSIVNSLATMTIKTLFDERKEVLGFYFGSSMGSKQKEQNKEQSHG